MSESKIWFCKIGEVDGASVPDGADLPMRMAVAQAYFELTGRRAEFVFSGWGGELDEVERAVVENREPSPEFYAARLKREAAPELYEALDSVSISGPDADGIIWLHVKSNGLQGMFNLGSDPATMAMRALIGAFELRRAALLKATPEQSDV